MPFQEHYEQTRAELADVCAQAGRDASAVLVLAVSKTVDVCAVRQASAAGAHDFGENRPDCILEKHDALPELNWHFIGNIQSRRIPDIVRCSCLIHSLFQESHARKIDAAARALGKVQDVLLEVNVSGEASKSGCAPGDVAGLLDVCTQLENLRVRGLMTMAPQGDAVRAQQTFHDLAALRDALRAELLPEKAAAFNELSMGMSEDWREAVLEGATIIRIGRALFSDSFADPHDLCTSYTGAS